MYDGNCVIQTGRIRPVPHRIMLADIKRKLYSYFIAAVPRTNGTILVPQMNVILFHVHVRFAVPNPKVNIHEVF